MPCWQQPRRRRKHQITSISTQNPCSQPCAGHFLSAARPQVLPECVDDERAACMPASRKGLCISQPGGASIFLKPLLPRCFLRRKKAVHQPTMWGFVSASVSLSQIYCMETRGFDVVCRGPACAATLAVEPHISSLTCTNDTRAASQPDCMTPTHRNTQGVPGTFTGGLRFGVM